ncbi:DNA polymerase delta subunit 3 [Rhynchospora pubera]|uniref:DNA polymerase delta subunit 3 n=1 Tax=Rhynchospora pubera TaxID=906938 RepID=A0AAV8FUI7_9POAL|nr:DNA polymerase delta subunit 3 [Rhynchospora pubera]
MGGDEAADIFLQIRSLVSDQLQVISYKWLSRNFSISSNNAKRLLREFVEKNGNDLQVIYTVSGWLKGDVQTYCVKLASAPKIDETRKEFEGICSVEVYSIQACIPKETAVIWNSEFLQAEELFNQPPTQDNCLRDNRFCGVSNSHVKRATDGKHESSIPPKPNNGPGAFQKDLQSFKPPKQEPVGPTSSSNLEANDKKSEKATKPSPVIREPSKLKSQNGKSSSGNSGSLVNMWGRASTKPKPVKGTEEDVPSIAATADEQIFANEAADEIGSDDDISDINYKRDSNNRKRRVVFDFSDDENEDEEEERVVSLSSPPETLDKKEKVSEVKDEKKKEKVSEVKEEKNREDQKGEVGTSKISNVGITLKLKSDVTVGGKGKEIDSKNDGAKSSPKRRKVLKTRIDERGREVSEFVWEGEPDSSDKPNQENAAKDTNNRPMVNKAPVLGSGDDQINAGNTKTSSGAAASSSMTNKPGGNKKPAKTGIKNPKQGTIHSFFKKV